MTFKTGNYRSGGSTGTSIELSHVLPQGYEWRKAPEGQLQLWRVDVSPEVLLTEQDIALLDVNGSIRAAVNTLYLEKAHAIKSSGEEIAFKNLETGVNYMPAWAASTPGGVDVLPLGGIVEGELITNFEPGGTLLTTGSVSAAFTSVITSNSTFYGTSYVCAEAYEGVLHLSVRDSRNEEVFHFDLPYASYSVGQVVSIEDIFYRVRVGNTRTIGVYKSNGDPLMVRPGSLDNTKPYRKYSVRSFSDRRVILAGGDGKISLGDLPDLNTSEAKVVNTEAERLALPEVDKLYIVTQITAGPNSAAGYQWFLNPNTNPSISNNWVRGANTGNSVLTFAGRSGPVEPQAGDYTPEQVGAVGLPGADGVRRVLIGNIPTQETIADDLVTNSSTSVLSARMGKQLQDSKQASITGAASTVTASNLSSSRAVVSDANGKLAASGTTSTEVGYLSGVTSGIQAQINGKQASITGAASTVTASNLSSSVAVVTDSNGKLAASGVANTELSRLIGVTSNVQTQLNARVATSVLSAKGDIIAASGASTPVRLPVGSNGAVLVADSSQTSGLRYQSALIPVYIGVYVLPSGQTGVAVNTPVNFSTLSSSIGSLSLSNSSGTITLPAGYSYHLEGFCSHYSSSTSGGLGFRWYVNGGGVGTYGASAVATATDANIGASAPAIYLFNATSNADVSLRLTGWQNLNIYNGNSNIASSYIKITAYKV